jgi:outer membrane immunogenic protein
VQGGCDYQFSGNWLIGAFADGDFGSIKGNAIFAPGIVVGEEKETGAWSVGGRIGYLLTPQFLTYVSAGYTEARFSQIDQPSFSAVLGPVGFVPARTSKGWFIGGGTEYELGWLPGLFWKAEYRYADYGTDSLVDICTFTNQFFCHFAIAPGQDVRTHIQTIRSGLVWRFDGGDSAGAAASPSPLLVKAPPAPAVNWTGCYVGAGGGYGTWSQDITQSSNGVPFGLPSTSGGRGGFGTVQGGCDYQFAGNWLAGGFADGDFGEITGNLLVENFQGKEREKVVMGCGGADRLFGPSAIPGIFFHGLHRGSFRSDRTIFHDCSRHQHQHPIAHL